MAGLGRRTFAAGEVLTAGNVMGYLQDQAVMNFAGTAARGSAIGSAVSEGMVSYLADSNMIETYSGTAWERQSGGLVPIAPTSITIATGSGSATALGVVSFSGATSIILSNVFSSAYKNYRIVINITSYSISDGWLAWRGMIGASEATSGTYYYSTQRYSIGNGTTTWSKGGTTDGLMAVIGSTGGDGVFDFMSPNVAVKTNVTGSTMSSYTAEHSTHGSVYSSNDQLTGIKLAMSSGNITGSVQVFGYND